MKEDNPCNACNVDVLDWKTCQNCEKYLNWRKGLDITIDLSEVVDEDVKQTK